MKATVNHTATSTKAYRDAVATVITSTGASYDTWIALLFEFGCRYAEAHYGPAALTVLTQKQYGFWAAWAAMWLDDDKEVLAPIRSLTWEVYVKEKKLLIQHAIIRLTHV